MQKKKMLAFALATTMILGSSMSVFAATGTGENTTGETVTGEGDVQYVDTTVYSVTLPTSATIKLQVDPQGLLGLTGDSATLEDLEEYAGKITCAATPGVINLSSVPMKVSVEMTLTGDATAVKSVSAVNSTDKANNVLLYAVPSAEDIGEDAKNYVGSTTAVVLSSTAAKVDFVLPAADYNFTKTVSDGDASVKYEVIEGTGHGTALSFAGLVNKNADWSAYAGGGSSIGMTAKFTFTSTLGGAEADSSSGAPYAMVAYTGDKVTVEPGEVAPSIAKTTYALTAGTPVTIKVNLGAGDKAATKVVYITDTPVKFDYLSKGYATYDADSKTITLTAKMVDACISSNLKEVIVFFDDAEGANGTKVPITFEF